MANNWPNDIDPLPIENLTGPLRKAFEQLYTFERTDKTSAKWVGPDITLPQILCCAHGIKKALTKEQLEYHEERGRDALEVLLLCALHLGMEQGLRMRAAENKTSLILLESHQEWLKKLIIAIKAGDQAQLKKLISIKDEKLVESFCQVLARDLAK